MLERVRLEDVAEGQVFLVGHVQEALFDTLPLGATAWDGDIDPAVLFVRVEVGVDFDPSLFVHGRVLGAELSDALVAYAVLPLEVEVKCNGDRDLAGPGGHQDRPGDGVPRFVPFLPWLRRDHLTDGITEEPDCVHGELLGVTRYGRRHPRERHYDLGLAGEFWRSASEMLAS